MRVKPGLLNRLIKKTENVEKRVTLMICDCEILTVD